MLPPATSESRADREIVAETFDTAVDDYNDRIEQALSFSGIEHRLFIEGKVRKIRELVAWRFADPGVLDALDLGCGIGNYDAPLASFFGALNGIDVSAQSIDSARRKHPDVDYSHYDGVRLPFSDERFDVVFAICVMHHVPPPDWPGFVSEIHRVLKPGGFVLIFEHNPLNPATQYIVRSCDIDADAVLLWPRKLRSIFRAAKFATVRSRTIFSMPPIGRFLQGLDDILGALPFGAQYYLSGIKPKQATDVRSAQA